MSAHLAVSGSEVLDLRAIQEALVQYDVDGWLFYFFRGNDALTPRILKLGDAHITRRWFYYIPKQGEPQKLVHRIEMGSLDKLPGERHVYLGWQELEQKLKEILSQSNSKKVAMQYSPRNEVPYISRVDAGIVELVRAQGVEIVSSGDLVQLFEARWSKEQLDTHIEAVEILRKIVFEGFAEIRRCIESKLPVNEYQIQQFIYDAYGRYGLISDSPPIVAVNGHAGSPHYQPNREQFDQIRKGDFVLFDIWARRRCPATLFTQTLRGLDL